MSVAPAHNGPYLEAIRVFTELLPDVPRVGMNTVTRRRSPVNVPHSVGVWMARCSWRAAMRRRYRSFCRLYCLKCEIF